MAFTWSYYEAVKVSYKLEKNNLHIQSGLFSIQTLEIDRKDIKDYEIKKGIINNILGLFSIDIRDKSYLKYKLNGINKTELEKLESFLKYE